MSDPIPASPVPPASDPASHPAGPTPVRIVSLHAENVKRLRVVDISPGDGVGAITIGGRNGAGKSSVLDAIQMALAGGKSMPPEPINADAVSAGRAAGDPAKMTIVATLSNGLIVKRTRRDGGKDYLEISNADGGTYRSPQAILDAMIGDLCFDPLAFTLMPPRDKRATLMKVAGLDFTQGDKDKSLLRDALRDAEAKHRATLAAIQAVGPATPLPRLDTSSIEARIAEAEADADRRRTATQTADRLRDAVDRADRSRQAAAARVEEIKAMLARATDDLTKAEELYAATSKESAEAAAVVAAMPAAVADIRSLRDELTTAREQNVRADQADQAQQRLTTLTAQRDETAQSIDDIKTAIKAIEEERVQRLREAAYPVPGLGLSDDGVSFNGRPLEQASQAEQLRVSVAMGLSMNPSLRVMLVRQGALLDDQHLSILSDMAAAADAQVWVERVGDDGTCAIVMEDGAVKIDRMNEDVPADAAD